MPESNIVGPSTDLKMLADNVQHLMDMTDLLNKRINMLQDDLIMLEKRDRTVAEVTHNGLKALAEGADNKINGLIEILKQIFEKQDTRIKAQQTEIELLAQAIKVLAGLS